MGMSENSSKKSLLSTLETNVSTVNTSINDNYDSQTITGIGANGAQATLTLTRARSKFSLLVVHTAGAIAKDVQLEVSLDGSNFFEIGTSATSTATEVQYVVDKPALYARVNVVDYGAGNTLTTVLMAQD